MDYCTKISRQLKGKTITNAQVEGDIIILKFDDNTRFEYHPSDGGYSTFSLENVDIFKEELDELTTERSDSEMTVKELKKILDYYDDKDLVELGLHTTESGSAWLIINNQIEMQIEN